MKELLCFILFVLFIQWLATKDNGGIRAFTKEVLSGLRGIICIMVGMYIVLFFGMVWALLLDAPSALLRGGSVFNDETIGIFKSYFSLPLEILKSLGLISK